MATNDGGSAFPEPWTNDGDRNSQAPDGQLVPPGYTVHMRGMSLRDWFAGQALISLAFMNSDTRSVEIVDRDKIARACYDMADAMLEARNG